MSDDPGATRPATPMPPLAGLRALDLTRLLPGPFAGQMLTELGVETLKVEEINGGDGGRTGGPTPHRRHVPPVARRRQVGMARGAVIDELGGGTRRERRDDGVDVVDAAAPGPAAHPLQGRPQARVVG